MNKKKQTNAPLHPMIWVSTSELSSPVRRNMPGERIKTMISNCITGNLAGGNYTRWLFFSTVSDRFGIWNLDCWFMLRKESYRTRRKTLQSKDKNQQQTQPHLQ